MFKRILSIFIVGVLSIGLVACGEGKQPTKTENTKQEAKKEEVKSDKEEHEKKDQGAIDKNQKDIDEHKEEISKLIEDIKNNYTNISSIKISPTEIGKALLADIEMIDNKDSTYTMISEIIVKNKVKFKNLNVNTISMFAKRNSENKGIIMFELQNDEYKPVVNTVE